MDWLSQVFAEQSIVWLLITSVVALASGFLSSWLTYRFIKRQEIIDQARWQGEIRKEVEDYLGDKSAEREYNLEARKRLYHAIGPLRFQLVVACKDVAARVANYGSDPKYSMTINGYYGQSTLYRLLRPLAIAELIEQQITYADFSVDLTAIGLLRFKRTASMALTDGKAILYHKDANWEYELQHLFSGTVSNLASSLIIQDEDVSNKQRPMHFHEFEAFIRDRKNLKLFAPLARILEDFTIVDKPIFWARLVCLGYVCNEYVAQAGSTIGFERYWFDVRELLQRSEDKYILTNIEKYEKAFQSLVGVSL